MVYQYLTIENVKEIYKNLIIQVKLIDLFGLDEFSAYRSFAGNLIKLVDNKNINDELFKLELQHAMDIVSNDEEIIKTYGGCPLKKNWVFEVLNIFEEIINKKSIIKRLE